METIQTLTRSYNFSEYLSILEVSYILASVLFILGLKKLGHPETARSGNLWAAAGMGLAILFTILFHKTKMDDGSYQGIHNIGWIAGALVIGSVVGWMAAKKVKMTAMPQMVSLFNGMGGACAALISMMEFPRMQTQLADQHFTTMLNGEALAILLGLMIGGVSFAGSMIAFGKLDERIGDVKSPVLRYINLSFLFILFAFVVFIMFKTPVAGENWMIYTLAALALVYGVTFVMPIGGADMPVVISVLNSYSGLVACTTGFVINNVLLIVVGALVGANGIILSYIMCKAMNRSLNNVLFGAFAARKKKAEGAAKGEVKPISPEDAFLILESARSVVITPGYGLAVAQAQHAVRELGELLEKNGADVKYAIHPVAGRMPGHMNVLLAEANVPYDQLVEMDHINPLMDTVDVAIVIGANDTVNPAALHDKTSPIYGMPIIETFRAKTVFVIKRSMAAGFAGIENELFYYDNTRMIFGDAKDIAQKLVAEFKSAAS